MYIYFFLPLRKIYKVVELVGGGSVIKGPTPSSLLYYFNFLFVQVTLLNPEVKLYFVFQARWPSREMFMFIYADKKNGHKNAIRFINILFPKLEIKIYLKKIFKLSKIIKGSKTKGLAAVSLMVIKQQNPPSLKILYIYLEYLV